jgi:nucleoid-associated protein YgaU
MKNPLVFFVGAAVVAVGAVAGVTVDRWRDWPTAFQTSSANPDTVADDVAAPEPDPYAVAPETAGAEQVSPGETQPLDVVEAPVEVPEAEVAESERMAAVESQAVESEPVESQAVESQAVEPDSGPEASSGAAAPQPAPETAVEPSFDVVRLEDDGSVMVAGRAGPNVEVALLLGDQVIGRSQANDLGEWLILPDAPLPPGSHQLAVQATGPSGAKTMSDQVIALAVPEREGDRPLVVLSEPSQPSQVLDGPQPPAAPEPAVEEDKEEPASLEPAAEPETPGAAEEKQVALAPLPEPEAPAGIAPQVENEIEDETTPRIDVPEAEAERPAGRIEIPLALETVDYNDDGDIIFSGRADPGHTIRIYVDNRFVGETTADLGGRWVYAGREQVAPGHHTLRADRIGATGQVLGRIELPFMRADSRDIAALVEARRDAAGDQEAAEAAPEAVEAPEPEAPAVAEMAEPEPEPEAPAVAEMAEPEPEPEAPAVAEMAESEPEPEVPAVAEMAEPEPEPKAPAVVEMAEPEPEPEAPAVAEMDEPEPGLPQVAAVEENVEQPAEPENVSAKKGRVVIQPGNNLWRISRVIYGRGVEYAVIYEANREQIRDPDLIYPGQIFTTPGVNPPEEIDPSWRRPLSPEELARQNGAE